MAITEYNYIPTYIRRTIANKPKDVVTANYWNELFNLLITQGDHTAEELGNILNYFTGVITDLANDVSQSTSGLSTKQDKLIAGKNITIAEDGKTISATQVIEVTLAEQTDGSYTADITFAQLKAEVDRGKQLMLVKDESKVFVLNSANDSEITFIGSDPLGVAYTLITVTTNEVWKVESTLTPNTSNISDIFSSIGLLANLTTDDKTHLVAAINEVNNNTDLALLRIDYDRSTKQDKLIAGENITIAADGKTISAIGGSSASIAMRVNGGYIQYSTDNGKTWVNLIAEADLKGDKGDKGNKGADGKSAYQYAQEGGYTGTEEEFAAKLAQEQLTGTANELTPTRVHDAVLEGTPVVVQYIDDTYGSLSFTTFNIAESLYTIVSQTIVYYNGVYILAELTGLESSNTWEFRTTILAQKTDIPTTLPNPNAITFTGAVTGSYNGSGAMTVNIPNAVTDAHINSLIDTKLGVIENGAY